MDISMLIIKIYINRSFPSPHHYQPNWCMVVQGETILDGLRGLIEICLCDWVTAATNVDTCKRYYHNQKNLRVFISPEISRCLNLWAKKWVQTKLPQRTHPFKPADTLSIADTFSKEGSTNIFCVTKWYLGDIALNNHRDKWMKPEHKWPFRGTWWLHEENQHLRVWYEEERTGGRDVWTSRHFQYVHNFGSSKLQLQIGNHFLLI